MIYLNLLSKEKRDALQNMRRGRFMAAMTVMVLVLIASISVILWLSAETLASNRQALEEDAPNTKNTFYERVATLNQTANFIIDIDSKNWHASELIIEIAKRTPSQIEIATIQASVERQELLLRGTAESRSDLLAFEAALNESPYFENVQLPLHAITQRTNIEFTLSATILTDSIR